MNDKANVLAAFTFIAFFLLLGPFVWHCRCKNIPAICLIFWLLFNNIVGFINSLIWSGPGEHQTWDGKGYCDVVTTLEAGASCGKVCAISALALNLYMILQAKSPTFVTERSARRLLINLAMCLITPVFVMSTNFIIRKSRYVLFRYRGCTTLYDSSAVSVALFFLWNLVWAIIAFVLSIMTLYKYFERKKDVTDILRCTNSGLSFKKFARLLIFNVLIAVVMIPVTVYYFSRNVSGVHGKFEWSKAHELWNVILFFDNGYQIVYDRWVEVALAIVTFLLFGLGSDAILMYKTGFLKVGIGKLLPQKKPAASPLEGIGRTLPSPTAKSVLSKMSTQTRVDSNVSNNFHKMTDEEKDIGNDIHISIDEDLPTEISSDQSSRRQEVSSQTPQESQEFQGDFLEYLQQLNNNYEGVGHIMNINEESPNIGYSYKIKHKPDSSNDVFNKV